jgi:sugar transferase EpsL
MFPKGSPISKRLLDLTLTSFCLVILSPLLLLIFVLIWIKFGRPILFRQLRPGFKGRPFLLYKFRSMTEDHDDQGKLLPDAERLTSFGRLLRDFSLDELPEMFNVLRGEMSWVGPRPLLMKYLQRYNSDQARRHEVLPGITGWAQVNGRNTLTWEDKFRYDVWYVDHWSFLLDLKILWMTAVQVLKREGISQPGHATAEEFIGSNNSDILD